MKQVHYPEIGKKYGNFKVISDEVFKYGKDKKIHYKVKCFCGHEQLVRAYFLEIGRQTCCRSCSQKKALKEHESRRKFLKEGHEGIGNLTKTQYNRYKIGARKRNIHWDNNLTLEYLYNLLIKQNKKCALSGLDIDLSDNFKGTQIDYSEVTASLDRIDSSKGYEVGNVQWVHKDINRMKNKHSEEYFIQLCKLVANQQRS